MTAVGDGEGFVHIGEVAERTGLSHRTIRYYEEMGLVSPAGRTECGFRLYDEAGIARLLLITPMKPLGFTIEQIGELLAALDTATAPEADPADRDRARTALDEAHAGVEQRIRDLKEATARAESFAERLGREVSRSVPGR